MGKLTDKSINGKIRAGERFELSDGGGLTLAFRDSYRTPVWRLRYRIAGTARVAVIGSYGDLPLSDARATAKELRARVTLGHDVAAEIQERKREAGAKIEAARAGAYTVGALVDDFIKQYTTRVKKVRGADGKLAVVKVPRWKHPEIVVARFEKDIRPELGELAVDEVKAHHVQTMLNKIVERGAPTTANDVLRWTRKIFDFAINQERTTLARNPAARLTDEDAGGEESARNRALSRVNGGLKARHIGEENADLRDG